jgi:hypothetical protein
MILDVMAQLTAEPFIRHTRIEFSLDAYVSRQTVTWGSVKLTT